MGMPQHRGPAKERLSQKELQELEDQSYTALSTLLAGKTQYDKMKAHLTVCIVAGHTIPFVPISLCCHPPGTIQAGRFPSRLNYIYHIR